MSKEKFKHYLEWFLLAAAVIVFYKTFDSLHIIYDVFKMILTILTPFIVGGALAYFLYPICKKMEVILEKTKKPWVIKRRLSLSVFITYFAFLLLLAILLLYLIPLTINNVMDFISKSGQYVEQFDQLVTSTFSDPKLVAFLQSTFNDFQIPFDRLLNFDVLKYAQGAINTAGVLLSWIMGIVICPYVLFERRNLMRIFDQFMGMFIDQKKIALIHYYVRKVHVIFSNFIYGKAVDSLIIGIIAYIGFSLLNLKFAFMLALIIMVTNMIPYFGPFIGGIPVVIITLIVMNPITAIWVALFIFALQQFDGLILGPAILGDSVGISPFWIIFAITLFGGLFGFLGMFLGVPLIAVIRMIILEVRDYQTKNSNKKLTDEIE